MEDLAFNNQADEAETITNVFVYGTLMTGYANHYLLKNYSAEKALLNGYRRIWPTALGFPIIVRDENTSVLGEIYRDVTQDTLRALDHLEGVPHYYYRLIVEVLISHINETVPSIVYYPSEAMIARWRQFE